MDTFMSFGFVIFAYLLGSISTAVVTCKVMGLPDPRTAGSHNPGATNVYQTAGKKAAIITLVGDLVKGLISVAIARLVVGSDEVLLSLVALSAFFGHLYPIYFGFKGGKGVATALGVIIGLNPFVALAVLLSWLVVFYAFKLSSLAALVTAIVTPLYFYIMDGSLVYTVMSVVMSLFLIVSHRSNIVKILDGTED